MYSILKMILLNIYNNYILELEIIVENQIKKFMIYYLFENTLNIFYYRIRLIYKKFYNSKSCQNLSISFR